MWGVPTTSHRRRQDGGGDVSGRRRRRDQGALDRLHQSRAVDAGPGHRSPRAGARGVRRGAGSVRHHRHRALRRPAAARHDLGREGRHGHQQRAPHQRVRPAVAARAKPATTGRSCVEFARRLEAQLRPGRRSLFPYATPKRSGTSTGRSTRGRDLDITGLSYAPARRGTAALAPDGRRSPGRARLYEDGIFPTADGRARFADTPYQPLAEAARPALSLFAEHRAAARPVARHEPHRHPGPAVRPRGGTVGADEPAGLARRRLGDGDLVHVTSRRGSIVVPVQASTDVGLSQAFIAMHWGSEFLSGCSSPGQRLAGVNAITTSAFCPDSKQPELKHAAVKILKAELPWSLLAASWLLGAGEALRRELAARWRLSPSPPACRSAVSAPACCCALPRMKRRRRMAERMERLLGLRGPRCCVMPIARKASVAPCACRRWPGDAARGLRCWRATPAPRPGSRAATGRAAGAGLRPLAARARRQGTGGGAVARQAGVHLLQRERAPDQGAPGRCLGGDEERLSSLQAA